MAPFDVLREYLLAQAPITDDEFVFMERLFLSRRVLAGQYVQRAGEPARYASFVTRGCLRSYIIDAKGVERIIQFAPERWWLSDIESLRTGNPSQFFVDAIEDSDVLQIDPPSHHKLVQGVPGYAESLRAGLQRNSGAKDKRIVAALNSTAEERYQEFMQTYPSIAMRVPQWMVASYLGISPETVSRIRRRASQHPPR